MQKVILFLKFIFLKAKRKYKNSKMAGERVIMNEKAVYVTPAFLKHGFESNLLLRKELSKVLLILNSHSSHFSDVEVLNLAAHNAALILCSKS